MKVTFEFTKNVRCSVFVEWYEKIFHLYLEVNFFQIVVFDFRSEAWFLNGFSSCVVCKWSYGSLYRLKRNPENKNYVGGINSFLE